MRILWWQLCPPGELCYVGLCYGCSVNQERMNVSAVPVAPWVSFQPLARLIPCLPWVQRTVRTVRYSETTGARNRMKNTPTGIGGGYPEGRGAWGSTGWRKPVTTMWHVATILLAWAPVEDLKWWTGHRIALKRLTSGDFPFAKQGGMGCCWHHGVDFPDCSED